MRYYDKETIMSLMPEKYHDIFSYFDWIHSQNADYKVFLSAQSFKFSALVLGNHAVGRDNPNIERLSMPDRWLMEAETIASHYKAVDEFPKTLFFDINAQENEVFDLIERMEAIILDCLPPNIDKKKVHNDLLRSCYVCSYTLMENGQLNIDYSVRKRMLPEEFAQLSQYINAILNHFDMNTSSTSFTVDMPFSCWKDNQKLNVDINEVFTYRGKSWLFKAMVHDAWTEVIQSHYNNQKNKLSRDLTATILFPKLSDRQFYRLCLFLTTFLDEIGAENLAEMIRIGEYIARPETINLISYLLSTISISSYIYHMDTNMNPEEAYLVLTSSDYSTKIRQFGSVLTLRYEFIILFRYLSKNPKFKESLLISLNNKKSLEPYKSLKNISKEALTVAENIFYDLGLAHEHKSNIFYSTPKEDRLLSYEFYTSYFDFMLGQRIEINTSLGYLFCLLNSGVITVNYLDGEEYEILCILKSELEASYLFSRRYANFMPALFQVEQYFCDTNRYFQENAIYEFITNYLPEKIDISQSDTEIMSLMEECELLSMLYDVGKRLKDKTPVILDEETYEFKMTIQQALAKKRENRNLKFLYHQKAKSFLDDVEI